MTKPHSNAPNLFFAEHNAPDDLTSFHETCTISTHPCGMAGVAPPSTRQRGVIASGTRTHGGNITPSTSTRQDLKAGGTTRQTFRSDPSVTDYILEEPARCPNCRREILEKALVEPLTSKAWSLVS